MMEKPMCLVEVTPSGGLLLNTEGLHILCTLEDAVEVVAMFGPKNTGKSFLLNQVPGMANGFHLPRTKVSKTPSIWMRCLPHPMGNSHCLVLLDTDGFSEEEDQKAFTMLFLLNILTCSVFIYNTRATQGLEEELTDLPYMTEAAKMVCVNPEFPDDTSLLLQGILPEFVCCMRDVPADPDMEEEMLLGRHSLDSVLRHDEDAPPVGYRLFHTRKLFHFSHPCSHVDDQDLGTLSQIELDPYFQGQASRFWDYVLSRKAKTTLGNSPVNGRILAGFLERYVELLAHDKVIILCELCNNFEKDICAFQQFASRKNMKKQKMESPKESSVCQQISIFASSHSPVKEIPQVLLERKTESVTLVQNAAISGPRLPKTESVTLVQNSAISGPRRPKFQGCQKLGNGPVPTMDEPICIIENLPGGSLQVNQEALNILNMITQPVVVVAIVGLYRTGKSYLMNKLAGKRTGFSLGSTIQSHTKGIWMWCVPHPQKTNCTLVLLDTEGLGDVEKGDSKNDTWIFALAVLLSSTFVYNSMATIDYKALEQLHYVTELTERIKVKSVQSEGVNDEDDSEFMSFFPAFVWTVRDFTLELVLEGREISADEYLENALKLLPDADSKANMPKQYIRRYFPARKCFVLDRPTSRKNLAALETLKEDQLEPDFITQTQKFCQYIYNYADIKTIKGGHVVTGTLLGNLALTYVDAIRSGTIPCMENAVIALAQIENSAAVQEALAQYVMGMEKAAQEEYPTETLKEFMLLHITCEKEAFQVFLDRSFKDEDHQFLEELAHQVEAKREDFQQRNDQASSDHCMAWLLEEQESIEEMVSKGHFAKPGGYQMFMNAQRQMVENYNFIPGKGLKAGQVLQEVLKSQESMAQTLLQTDNALTQKEKEAAEERARAEALQREVQVKQEMHEQAQQMLADQQRAHKAHTRQLQQKMEADRAKLVQEQDMVIARKLQEHQRLLQEGFNQESVRLQGEIQRLQAQIPRPRSPPRRKCIIS
ncbi:guanylate-binding protein 1-like [Ambystoma mexicanum]|uniref:guanylate-binding protein 1-like n=1 Tax=Ambystoma mexicanum TaxID=8296 RepID=UPI0037E7F899